MSAEAMDLRDRQRELLKSKYALELPEHPPAALIMALRGYLNGVHKFEGGKGQLAVSTEVQELADLCEIAWGVIANVSEADWSKQPAAWVEVAERWRDRWHKTLPSNAETVVARTEPPHAV